MTTEQRTAWVQFRAVRFHPSGGAPAAEFHPSTRVYGDREAQELARQAFEAGVRAAEAEAKA
jgi:hypothetical protein